MVLNNTMWGLYFFFNDCIALYKKCNKNKHFTILLSKHAICILCILLLYHSFSSMSYDMS